MCGNLWPFPLHWQLSYTLGLQKMPPSHYFLFNTFKNETILIIFGTQNPEDIQNYFLHACQIHLKNVTAPLCEMQNFSHPIEVI